MICVEECADSDVQDLCFIAASALPIPYQKRDLQRMLADRSEHSFSGLGTSSRASTPCIHTSNTDALARHAVRRDGKAVGFIFAGAAMPAKSSAASASTPSTGASGTGCASACLQVLAVLAAYRERGIGSALLQAMVAAYSTRGLASEVSLHVQTNNSDAVRLYRKFKFTVSSTEREYYPRRFSNGCPDCHVMRLSLPGTEGKAGADLVGKLSATALR